MRPSTLLCVVLLAIMAACQGHTGGAVGPRLDFALESSGLGPPPSFSVEAGQGTSLSSLPGAGELEGSKEVFDRAAAAAHGLTRVGAWLALGLRVEEGRLRLLALHAHEGTGNEMGAVAAKDFRPLLEWALYRYVRGQRDEVVVTLRRGEGGWREEVESTGPVLSAAQPQAPYEAFVQHQRETLRSSGLSEAELRERLSALKKLEREVGLRAEAVPREAPSPLARYVALLQEERRREERWRAVQRKLVEYEAWGRKLLETYRAPPHRVAPGYLLTESPLREQSLWALGNATLAWAYAHTEDPDFLRRTPEEVALYLLASRSALASAVQLGRLAPVHLDYSEALDPEVYTSEELVLELLMGLTPGVGEVTDARAAVMGESFTGHRLSRTERVVCALGVLLPFVTGSVLLKAGEDAERLALLTGRSLEEVEVLSRVASHLSPTDAREVERLVADASRGHTFTEEELRFLNRVAHGLETPLREAAGALRAGQKVPLLGVRVLPDGSRLLPGTRAHKAQRWVDYQFRYPEKYSHFTFQPDADWERMYETILKNRPAGNAFEDAILQAEKYERNAAMMMPPPGSSSTRGFIPDSVKGNPAELVWGQPYNFVEAKARKELSLSGNLEAMIDYVEEYGGHLELWVRSAMHADGPTHLSRPLLQRLKKLEREGKASWNFNP